MPRTLDVAIRQVGNRGVSVVVMFGDIALKPAIEAPIPSAKSLLPPVPIVIPERQEFDRLAGMLNGDKRDE
jgi:pyruvate dehydrogenase (quinone)